MLTSTHVVRTGLKQSPKKIVASCIDIARKGGQEPLCHHVGLYVFTTIIAAKSTEPGTSTVTGLRENGVYTCLNPLKGGQTGASVCGTGLAIATFSGREHFRRIVHESGSRWTRGLRDSATLLGQRRTRGPRDGTTLDAWIPALGVRPMRAPFSPKFGKNSFTRLIHALFFGAIIVAKPYRLP